MNILFQMRGEIQEIFIGIMFQKTLIISVLKNIIKSKHFGIGQVKLLLLSTLLNSVRKGNTNNIHGWESVKFGTNCYYFIRVRVSYFYKLLMSYNSIIKLQRKPTLDSNQVSSYISRLYQASTILNTLNIFYTRISKYVARLH